MSKIQVAIRVRPEPDSSKQSKNMSINRDNGVDLYVNATKHEFQFDKIFPDDCSQESIFKHSTTTIINDVIEGFNGCILTYGQTGAGKTYTMSGPSADNYEERGLVARSAAAIFQKCALLTDSVTIRLSVLEIYNETLIDLLREPIATAPSSNMPAPPPKLSIIESSTGVVVPALYVLPISSEDDAYTHLLEAYQNRVVAEHQLNRKSSRSHVIYTFYITRTRSEDDVVVQSKLNLIDLAGSERVEKTGTSGVNQKEASYINKSLSFLEQVVLALSQSKREHIPYRQSKLTYILKDSLGGNCATYMIACVWPNQLHEWETLSTLRFATRMKCIENHPIRNTLVSKEPHSTRLVQQIEMLRKELVMRDTMNHMDPWLPDLTKAQKLRTIKQISGIASERPSVHDTSLPIEVDLDLKSISQCKLMLGFMRRCLWDACGGDSSRVSAAIQGAVNTSLGLSEGGSPIPANKSKDKGGHGLSSINDKSAMGGGGVLSAREPTLDNGGNHLVNFYSNEGISHLSPSKGGFESIPSSSRKPNINNNDSNNNNNNYIENIEDSIPSKENNGIFLNHIESPVDDSRGRANGEGSVVTFETFSAGEGRVFHDSFMDTKEALKANKARQREIIQILNRQKMLIDNCNEILQRKERYDKGLDSGAAASGDVASNEEDGGENLETFNSSSNGSSNGSSSQRGGNWIPANEMSGEYISGIRMQYESSKRDYRAAHNELQICKKQVGELEQLKQRALAVLLKEFDEFSKSVVGEGGSGTV